jgi:hypothetical protein
LSAQSLSASGLHKRFVDDRALEEIAASWPQETDPPKSQAQRCKLRRLKLRNTFIGMVVLAGVCLVGAPKISAQAPSTQTAPAAKGSQQGISDQDIQLLRQDIRSKKKQLVAANLSLTTDEATKFWPVYDQYTAELVKINDTKYAALKEYAENWGKMTNEQATSLLTRSLGVDQAVAQLRIKYVPIFEKVIPGTKVASFFQIDRRLQMLIDAQLASQIPLVQDQQ